MSGLVVSTIARVIFSLFDSCLPSFPHHLANFYWSFKDAVQTLSSRKPSPTTPASNLSSGAFSLYGFFCIFLLVLCFLWKHMVSYTFYLFMYHQTHTHTHTLLPQDITQTKYLVSAGWIYDVHSQTVSCEPVVQTQIIPNLRFFYYNRWLPGRQCQTISSPTPAFTHSLWVWY